MGAGGGALMATLLRNPDETLKHVVAPDGIDFSVLYAWSERPESLHMHNLRSIDEITDAEVQALADSHEAALLAVQESLFELEAEDGSVI